ncbi:MAG: hypothetical protein H0W15_08280, partial [Gemmatimonadales bacterium]|nr:hypothetical protein [Gemmatimonadales bacterium]
MRISTPTPVSGASRRHSTNSRARELDPRSQRTLAALLAYFAGYNELGWALESPEQELLFRLSPAAFDTDRAWWGQSVAIMASQRGDK